MTRNTAFITGSSSGIGKATALHFQKQGWNVAATMRNPEEESELTKLDGIFVTRLDVTDERSIETAVEEALARFERIDLLVNNAGFGAYGPLEVTSTETIRRQFDTNVIGALLTAKALLPHFRRNRRGVIVNVSSMGGRFAFPLGALYHGSKFAIEGVSEALAYEAAEIGVRVKIIEPGMVSTGFGDALDFSSASDVTDYDDLANKLMSGFEAAGKDASPPEAVAEAIFRAATDGSEQLRYPVGPDAEALLAARKVQDDAGFMRALRTQLGL